MATLLSSKAVGDIVKLKEDGVLQDYIVVHQGLPSSIYDSSCDGTWLLRKTYITSMAWGVSNSTKLASSNIHLWLNSSNMLNKYEISIRNVIKQVKIPYLTERTGDYLYGSSGISCKIFMLSGYEVGMLNSIERYLPIDGAKLDYFETGIDSSANSKRSIGDEYWLRSPNLFADVVWYVESNGRVTTYNASNILAVRPALILPSTSELAVNNSGEVYVNNAPTVPASITVPTAMEGKMLDISWTASTDAQGDTIKYQLERSTNGGSFSKIYDGTATTYKDTVSTSWNTVQYRVRAYDIYTAYSGYKTGTSNTVLHLAISNITIPSIAMTGQPIPISWASASSATSYTLERKADSGRFESIYTGSDTSYTDTAGEWTSVVYRVKAEKSGNFGDYKTATAVAIVPSSAIAISGTDSDLGTLTKDVPYTVSSDTGNKIDLERYVNGQLMAKIQVNSGFLYTIPVVDLPTGTGTIKLVATVNTSASLPVSETRTWTYTKQVVNFADSGGVSTLEQDGKNIFPTTLCEAVRVPTVWGGSLDKALEMLLPVVNMAVMAVGSYVGSGTFGKDSPNSITLDFTPQMVIISGGDKSLNISNTLKTDSETAGYIENKKVTWYSTSADEQLNTSDVTYTYIAIGKRV